MEQIIIDKRYRILQKLGAGAMGEVYEVKDLTNNEIVALKLLFRKESSSETVQRFKREFKLLTELHHPNLCEVYDFGTLKDGRSYFTMEYIEGKDIFTATEGLKYEEIYPIIVQVCRVLEYIHSKGLIHYDIKPSNILIETVQERKATSEKKSPISQNTASPILNVKLMDFGLAGEQRIKGRISVRGTVPYIAPEVIKGLAIDHRADLYSFGILLYEIFSRRTLQIESGKSLVTIFKEAIAGVREPLSKIVPDVPKGLENLILRLTAIEPAERYSRANEVIEGINRLSRRKFEMETTATLKSYLLSSKFVGREKEFEMLKDVYIKRMKVTGKEISSAISPYFPGSPCPSLVVISGEPGIGKSRLLREFKVFVQFQRGHCLTGCAHPDTKLSYHIFHGVFKELLSYIDNTEAIEIPLAVVSRIFPDILNTRFKPSLPKLAPLEPKQEKLRVHEALSELLKHVCSKLGNTVILLEDLHWADLSSIEFLEYLARNLTDTNILICATYRSGEESDALKKLLENITGEDYFLGVELKPLTLTALSSFLDSIITSASNSPELAHYLLRETGGNPFFAEEMLRALFAEKRITIGEKIVPQLFGKTYFPKGIEDVLAKRLTALSGVSKEIVKYAAVCRKEFDFNLIKRLTMLSDTVLSRAFWELKQKQILVEEDNFYKFYHNKFRETILRKMPPDEIRELNYRVGICLEEINKKELNEVVEDLASYFINSKDKLRGIKYGLKAANKSRGRYANEQAIEFYQGVLGLLGSRDSKRRFDTLNNLARVEVFAGFYDSAIKHYQEAFVLDTTTIHQKIEIYHWIGDIYEKKGEVKRALEYYYKGLALLKKARRIKQKSLLKGKIYGSIGFSYMRMADYENAEKFSSKALGLLKALHTNESIREINSIYNTFGIINCYKGNYDKAIFYFDKGYKYCKRVKNEDRMRTILNNLGNIYYMKGNLQQAIDYYQNAMAICEKIRNPDGISTTLINLGNTFSMKGDYLKSLEYYERALLCLKKIGNVRGAGIALFDLGNSFLMMCNYRKAKEYYEEALQYAKKISDKEVMALAIFALGDLYQAIGNYHLALKSYRDSLKIEKEIGYQRGIAVSLKAIGSVFIELGELQKARTYVIDGLNIAMSVGLKDIEIESYILLGRISIMTKDYIRARSYYEKGMKIAKESGMKQQILLLLLLVSETDYFEQRYSEGIEKADKARDLAKEINTKDAYVEALLIKAKNEIKIGLLPKIKIIEMLKEAIEIAEEIKKPELLWKVYFEYGKILHEDRQYREALEYYEKCIKIFIDVTEKIKVKRYKESYVSRSDRQEIFTAIKGLEALLEHSQGFHP